MRFADIYDKASDRVPPPLKELMRTAVTRVGCALGKFPGVELLGAHLRELFPALGIDCVLDVGAHRGQYGRFLRNIGYRGKIVSFEPEPQNYARLRAIASGDARWLTVPAALGERDGEASFNVAHISTFSSFLEPSAYSFEQFGNAGATERVIRVPMRRLDSVLDELITSADSHALFLKMDTQGYDSSVLDGAFGVLEAVRGIQTEVSVKALYEGMTSFDAAITRMTSLGFELTGLFPVTRDLELRVVEFDCVVRRVGAAVRHATVASAVAAAS